MIKSWALGLCVAMLVLGVAAGVASNAADPQPDVKQQIEELKKGQEAIQKDLAEIKRLLQARPAAPAAAAPAGPNVKDVVFNLGDNHVQGKSSAKITLVEFTDFQCPYCARYAKDTYPQIAKEYVETGKIRYVMLDLPLDFHKNAFKAAEAAHCAGDQGKYWPMHDRLFENHAALDPFAPHAEAVGLDPAAFDKCMSSGKYTAAVKADLAESQKAGITGTPGFVLATTDPKDPKKVKGLSFLRGAQPFAAFKTALDQALAN
jgi:protein-disulfide isomerase